MDKQDIKDAAIAIAVSSGVIALIIGLTLLIFLAFVPALAYIIYKIRVDDRIDKSIQLKLKVTKEILQEL